MTSVDLSAPVVRRAPPAVDAAALEAALMSRVDGEVRFDDGSRGAYATDASRAVRGVALAGAWAIAPGASYLLGRRVRRR